MYKPCSNFLLILVLVICLLNARAQSPDWYRGSINRPYQLAGDFKDARLYPIGSEPDSIKLQITSLADVQAFIAKGLQNKVYAIGVDNKARPDLTAIFSLVLSFPKLAYIRIIDREFPSDNDKAYQLPDGVKKLKNLKGFEFDYTDKIDMPNALTKLKLLRNLQILVFTEYEHKLPSVINQLRQVKTVDLSTHNIGDNDLAPVNWETAKIWGDHIRASGFPYVIDPGQEDALKRLANVKSLRKLDVYLYHLWDTTVLSRFTQIKSLSFGGILPFNIVVNQIGKLSNLQQLSIHDDYGLNPSIAGLANLAQLQGLTLFFSGGGSNQSPLAGLTVLGGLGNLRSLSIFASNIGNLPDIFNGLPMLNTVSLQYNKITSIPQGLFNLPALESLNLSDNNIAKLPEGQMFGCKNLKNLNIAENGLTVLPNAITRLENLQNFEAQENNISYVPNGWENLGRLKKVDLSGNRLTAYPGGLQNNTSVENVNVYKNKISSIGEIQNSAYQLKSLALSANPLTSLPIAIGNYTNLERLDATSLNLQALPTSLGNCKKLKTLFLYSSIKAPTVLPAGLEDDRTLETLQLDGDSLLDKKSVFDVVLNVPRNNFYAGLAGMGITELPADARWVTVKFLDLDLSGNHLKTLPPEFATTTFTRGMVIRNNPMKGNRAILNASFKTHGDFKVLFGEMNALLPKNYQVADSDYAAAMAKYIWPLYNAKEWTKAIAFAEKAKKVDSVSYFNNVRLDVIGVCRFNMKDYKNAITDLERFLYNLTIPGRPKEFATSDVNQYVVKAFAALNQPDEMARAYVKMGGVANFIKAAAICDSTNNKTLYHQLLDSAMLRLKKDMDNYAEDYHYNAHETFYSAKGEFPPYLLIEYAMMQLTDGKPADAIATLNKNVQQGQGAGFPPVKNLLLAVSNYLIDPANFERVKNTLAATIPKDGKIGSYYWYTPIDNWVNILGLLQKQTSQLLVLQSVVK